MKLIDAAKVIRSKNAGPLSLTIDLMFADEEGYRAASASPNLTAGAIARLYGISANTVAVIPYEAALAVKLVIDRPIVAGSPGDSDAYGAQQHTRLLDLDL
ncbi:MAG TPA: DUF4387 domain-containing protein [Amaricoccus sp.]|uniref:DUF4387 domain-containing protein n=1 Tax=Amaricoccus sp. TaxID=1872485 RepID=UPI002CF33A29|nr:DUF4387 domain-containing protein [Amaricoccus sp.]HMR34227.1 DUF4387 domain-containing protein [Geminicoccus sp.]HMU00779.1 DUF4387 domain-containing protein [Amaricoccus sp.]